MHQEHGDDMVALPTTILVMVVFAQVGPEPRLRPAKAWRAAEEAASR